MTIKNDAKFEKEFTRQFKIDMSLTNSPEHVQKSKNWDFDGILLSKIEVTGECHVS